MFLPYQSCLYRVPWGNWSLRLVQCPVYSYSEGDQLAEVSYLAWFPTRQANIVTWSFANRPLLGQTKTGLYNYYFIVNCCKLYHLCWGINSWMSTSAVHSNATSEKIMQYFKSKLVLTSSHNDIYWNKLKQLILIILVPAPCCSNEGQAG